MQLALRVKPSVVVWYKVFCSAMAALYGLLLFLGVFVLNSFTPNDEAFIDGILLVLFGPPFAIAFGLGIFWDEMHGIGHFGTSELGRMVKESRASLRASPE